MVIQYTGDDPFESTKAAKEFIQNYDQYRKYGFGRWAVLLKETQTFIGWCGLKYSAELDEHDIGFRFFQEYWGNGYATEAAQKCIELAKNEWGLHHLVGRAAKENTASIQVLKKLGFSYKKEMDCHGLDAFIFEIIL